MAKYRHIKRGLVKKILEVKDPEREQKAKSLKEKLKKGEYAIPSALIAEAIIRNKDKVATSSNFLQL